MLLLFFLAGSYLISPHRSGVNSDNERVRVCAQTEYLLPKAVLRLSAVVAFIDTVPLTESFGEVSLLNTGFALINNGIDKQPGIIWPAVLRNNRLN